MAELTPQQRAQRLADAFLAQGVTLARLEAGTQARISRRLSPLFGRLRTKVRNADLANGDALATRLARAQRVARDAASDVTGTYQAVADELETTRLGIMRWAVEEARAILGDVFGRAAQSTLSLERLAKQALVQGASAVEWAGRHAATLLANLSDRLRQGVLQERSEQALVSDLQQLEASTVRNADALVQTTMAAAQQVAQHAVIQRNGRDLDGSQWLTTLDTKACLQCIALSGQAWTFDHAPLRGSGPWPGEPPLHFNCRCTLVPIPSGATPIEDVSFETWLRTRPATAQRAILGPGRFALWQSGRLRLRQLVDQRHRPLTLEQLRSESAA